MLFGYDGEAWVPIVDSHGNELTEGAWVVPEWNDGLSWEILDNGSPSGITIKVYHFSSFTAGTTPGSPPSTFSAEGGGGGGGCFINTLMGE